MTPSLVWLPDSHIVVNLALITTITFREGEKGSPSVVIGFNGGTQHATRMSTTDHEALIDALRRFTSERAWMEMKRLVPAKGGTP